MTLREAWEQIKAAWRELVGDIHGATTELKRKEPRRKLGPGARTVLWFLLLCNAVTAVMLAATIVFIPLAIVLVIASIYIYNAYLRRG